MKKCHSCKKNFASNLFHKNNAKADGLATECKLCRSKYLKNYYRLNRQRLNNENKRRGKINYRNARFKVLFHYSDGKMKCACHGCDEKRQEFLSLNHMKGNGNKHRKKIRGARTFYEILIKNNFPSGFNILCYNCNCSKGFNGYCPHEREVSR